MKRPQTAAEWFAARLQPHDTGLDLAFQAWLAADPANADEYALCEISWNLSADAAWPPPLSRINPSRRSLLAGAATLAAAAIGGASFWAWHESARKWVTGPGEQRTVLLKDGSRLTLNTRTSLSVMMTRSSRDIDLKDGEAYFEVARDASRPFTVRTTLGSVRAVGTHFNVYLQPTRLSVTTTEGRVLVNAGPAGLGVYVGAGRQATVEAGASNATLTEVDPGSALGWREHRIDVNDVPLSQALEEFSRYTVLPVRAVSPGVGALRVTAVLRAGDLDALESTLREAFGLTLKKDSRGYLVQDPRQVPGH